MAAEKLTDEEIVAFREAFGKYDPEGSNHVDTENIGSVLRAAGQAPTEADVEEYQKVSRKPVYGDAFRPTLRVAAVVSLIKCIRLRYVPRVRMLSVVQTLTKHILCL